MKNKEKLLEEAKWGKLNPEDLKLVIQTIQSSKPGDDEDLYTWIHILGRSRNVQYRKLVEYFLYYPSNPMISYIALKTLCNYWHFTKDYLKEIKSFIKGVDWDQDQDLHDLAISCAGSFLQNEEDKELLELIVEIVQNFAALEKDSLDAVSWESAFTALVRAMGKEVKEVNGTEELKALLQQAKQRLENLNR